MAVPAMPEIAETGVSCGVWSSFAIHSYWGEMERIRTSASTACPDVKFTLAAKYNVSSEFSFVKTGAAR